MADLAAGAGAVLSIKLPIPWLRDRRLQFKSVQEEGSIHLKGEHLPEQMAATRLSDRLSGMVEAVVVARA